MRGDGVGGSGSSSSSSRRKAVKGSYVYRWDWAAGPGGGPVAGTGQRGIHGAGVWGCSPPPQGGWGPRSRRVSRRRRTAPWPGHNSAVAPSASCAWEPRALCCMPCVRGSVGRRQTLARAPVRLPYFDHRGTCKGVGQGAPHATGNRCRLQLAMQNDHPFSQACPEQTHAAYG